MIAVLRHRHHVPLYSYPISLSTLLVQYMNNSRNKYKDCLTQRMVDLPSNRVSVFAFFPSLVKIMEAKRLKQSF